MSAVGGIPSTARGFFERDFAIYRVAVSAKRRYEQKQGGIETYIDKDSAEKQVDRSVKTDPEAPTVSQTMVVRHA